MWWPWKRRRQSRPLLPPEVEASAEQTRIERGKLAESVVEFDRKRHHIEDLMGRMLEETRRA
jgi:hypothetical protein